MWRRTRGRPGGYCVMEASRIAGDSGPEGDIAKESRKVKVEACPVEISVTLG